MPPHGRPTIVEEKEAAMTWRTVLIAVVVVAVLVVVDVIVTYIRRTRRK